MGIGKKSSKARLINHNLFKYIRAHRQDAIAANIQSKDKLTNYQSNDLEKFKLGEEWFNNGFTLDEVSENLKNNISFINGFNRAKRISEIEKCLYDLGTSYFYDGVTVEQIPENYRNNPTVLRGYEDATKKSKSR